MKAVVFSLGCKVNQCEGQSIISDFEALGIQATDALEFADVYVINTCSVTGEADRKSRQTVARVLKLNPAAAVYVCGCSSQNDYTAFTDKPNVRLIFGTADKSSIARRILDDLSCSHAPICKVCELPKVYEENTVPEHTKTRAYVKIQDGCNNFCSYCIIPYLRGRSRSRSIDSILTEITVAAKATKEIVLTGIDASSYGKDIGESVTSLVKKLGGVDVRKRFGSLECAVIDRELLEVMAENGFCDHFHLSLQSGSESVLKRMNRKYTPEYFLSKVELIRSVFPHAGITTDVIAGFGGETEEEFLQTVEFVQKVGFSEMHVFPYSERKGTRACALPQIPKSLRQQRANELIKIGKKMQSEFLDGERGRRATVYAETEENGYTVGYTSNYIKVYSSVPLGSMGEIIITEKFKEGVKGERI